MRHILAAVAVAAALTGTAQAQTATPTSRLAWDQVAPSLAAAQNLIYEGFFDGSATVTPLVVACTGATSPYTCVAPFPPLVPGSHAVQLRAVDVTTVPGTRIESPLSVVFSFSLVALPSAPTNLRITPAGGE